MFVQKTFGEFLKEYRRDHNLTQKEFAELLGRGQSTIATWEGDKSLPDTKETIIIARTIDVSVNELNKCILASKQLKYDGYRQIAVELDLPINELKEKYNFQYGGQEVTEEELKKALEIIEFARFKQKEL